MELPLHCVTVYQVRTRFCETDLMGVIHHGAYIPFLEAARIEYLRRRGITYLEWTLQGIHLPVVETRLCHRRPAYFDDVLSIEARLAELGRVRARFEYKVFRLQPPGPELIADGATVLACVDSTRKLCRIPASASERLLSPETVPPELLG